MDQNWNRMPEDLKREENEEHLTPYQRVLERLANEPRWLREIDLGRRIGFYRFHGDLGTGNFSQVKSAIHCLIKERVAIKILDKNRLDAKTEKMLSREIMSMESLHHPHIIRLYEVIETFSKIYLIMEYAKGGELFHKISQEGRLSEPDAKIIFRQITSALEYMHENNIVHRDLKAENVFFAHENYVKVGDFGFSTQVSSHDEALKTFCGSPPYAAPELFKDESYLGVYVDIWALGILLYFLVTGSVPFKAQTVSSLKKVILEGDYTVPPYLSNACSKLLHGILQQTPLERWSLAKIKSSEWLKEDSSDELEGTTPPLPAEDSEVLQEALLKMNKLGISDQMLHEEEVKGSRSYIVGTYRIVLHKFQTADIYASSRTSAENIVESCAPPRHYKKSKACIVL